jgi:hypothetical protein
VFLAARLGLRPDSYNPPGRLQSSRSREFSEKKQVSFDLLLDPPGYDCAKPADPVAWPAPSSAAFAAEQPESGDTFVFNPIPA